MKKNTLIKKLAKKNTLNALKRGARKNTQTTPDFSEEQARFRKKKGQRLNAQARETKGKSGLKASKSVSVPKRKKNSGKQVPLVKRFKYHSNLIMHPEYEADQYEIFLPVFELNKRGKKMHVQKNFEEDNWYAKQQTAFFARRAKGPLAATSSEE